ncbi:MAG TPA: hypothetical protein ENK85_00805, partial [Saprospiraceae bacterium]|nr:hypothetical protein [Saprospiraceae bacterium]
MSPLKLFFFLFLVPFALRSQSTLMRGEVIAFDAQNFAQARIAEDGSIPSFYRLAHFSQIPTSKQRARLEAKGVQFLEYYLNATYLVAFKQPVSEELCRSIGMDGLVTIPTAAKLSPKVKERPIPSWAKGKNDQVKIIVEGYKNTLPSVFVKWIQDFGVQVDFSGRHECYVEVTTSTKNIELLAALPGVSFIDWINPPDVLDDDNGRAMHRSNVLDSHYPGGRHYDGTG